MSAGECRRDGAHCAALHNAHRDRRLPVADYGCRELIEMGVVGIPMPISIMWAGLQRSGKWARWQHFRAFRWLRMPAGDPAEALRRCISRPLRQIFWYRKSAAESHLQCRKTTGRSGLGSGNAYGQRAFSAEPGRGLEVDEKALQKYPFGAHVPWKCFTKMDLWPSDEL